ncbi:unnamed protein product, partial [marine sediment metagenome]
MKILKIWLITTLILLSGYSSACTSKQNLQDDLEFNGERAYQDIEYQLNLGPRVPG